jgi:transposase IS4-like protein
MPRQSNDEDLVTYTTSKPTKGPAPVPPPIPFFEPLIYAHSKNTPRLPPHIDSSDPGALFDLFFDNSVIEIIVKATNENAKHKKAKFDAGRDAQRATGLLEQTGAKQRRWRDVTSDEIRAYFGISIWMGCQRLKNIKEYWNTQPENGAVFELIRRAMSLGRWEQIHRYFYVNNPGTPNLRPFDKMDELADLLRERFRRYMKPGSDVAVDECIEGFEGRAREIVNIPSKPTPIGFKQWVLASDGYVFDWLWHARGSGKQDGPQGLDRAWIDEGFSATQAVVLTLMRRMDNQGRGHSVWLDNLFTSARLLKRLRDLGIGGAGTVRTTKTKREEKEEKSKEKSKSQVRNSRSFGYFLG